MSRRGRSGPTISLFSFQDIITSVTAIVTVITLLLALDLVLKKESQASDPSISLAAQLTKHLERAESELAQLKTVTESTDVLVREVAGTSPVELRDEIAQRESAIADLEHEMLRLEKQGTVWMSKEKEVLAEQFDLEPMNKSRLEAESATEELERQRHEENAENRVIYSLPRGMQKEGWLVVIDLDQVAVAPMGRPAKPTTFVATGLPFVGSSPADHFAEWITKRRLNSSYFLLLIRPNGASVFESVHQKLDRLNVSQGFDLIGAQQIVLHPERGAVP